MCSLKINGILDRHAAIPFPALAHGIILFMFCNPSVQKYHIKDMNERGFMPPLCLYTGSGEPILDLRMM